MSLKIFVLTDVGKAIASNPYNKRTDANRILSYLRGHGHQATSEQIQDHLQMSGYQLRNATNELLSSRAITVSE